MMQRKLNGLLLLFSLLGGAVAFLLGELLLGSRPYDMPMILLVGIYFAVAGLCIGIGCLVAEMIAPRLNGYSWKQRYVGLSWKLLPLLAVLLLAGGSLMEFVYELNFGGVRTVKDVVMVIDDSGSMQQTDPDNRRYSAAENLVSEMKKDNRVAVITFSDQAQVVQPLTRLSNTESREQVLASIRSLQTTQGGTDLSEALNQAMSVMDSGADSGRGAMVILLSDGISQFAVTDELAIYQQRGIAVNTIGLALDDPTGPALLQSIASSTGGQYYDVAEATQLADVFRQIYDRLGDRTLLTERSDSAADSPYYAAVRVLSLLLLGAALGVGLGAMFDNRYLARSFGTGGAVSGLIAGLVLELGLSGHTFGDAMTRLMALLILALILSLFTYVVPIGEGRISRRKGRAAGADRAPSEGFQGPRRGRGSKGF